MGVDVILNLIRGNPTRTYTVEAGLERVNSEENHVCSKSRTSAAATAATVAVAAEP